MKRGEIWWASLSEPTGSEPGYGRPVVIISSNDFNRSNIKTVICAAITSNLRLAESPGNFKITKKSSGLNRDSVVNISQIFTIDKSFLSKKTGFITGRKIHLLNGGVKLVLAF